MSKCYNVLMLQCLNVDNVVLLVQCLNVSMLKCLNVKYRSEETNLKVHLNLMALFNLLIETLFL